jgi:hypothetical protein
MVIKRMAKKGINMPGKLMVRLLPQKKMKKTRLRIRFKIMAK